MHLRHEDQLEGPGKQNVSFWVDVRYRRRGTGAARLALVSSAVRAAPTASDRGRRLPGHPRARTRRRRIPAPTWCLPAGTFVTRTVDCRGRRRILHVDRGARIPTDASRLVRLFPGLSGGHRLAGMAARSQHRAGGLCRHGPGRAGGSVGPGHAGLEADR
jgi:hypothetical protein